MKRETSTRLFEEAKQFIPGGVNSPVRAFRSVGGNPPFIVRASGSKIYDIDGNEYIDYVGSWGPIIVGHAHAEVIERLKEVMERGTSFGAPTELETKLAEMVVHAVPSIEMVRMVNSGTEATMSAIRLARGYTGRDKIVKFAGCYHGHGDSLLVKAGSGATTFGIPDSPGVPADFARNTITARFNDLESVKEVFCENGDDIACIIVEPIPGNMGVIPPVDGFLQGLREVTKQHGSLLIFDEVMSGFRVAYGGAQELFGITPDLTCLGKIIGGGLPVGAYGGKKEIMEKISPLGPVYQAGTLSGNPLAMTAGICTLEILSRENAYEQLEEKSRILCDGIVERAKEAGVPTYSTRIGAMFCTFFTDEPVHDYESALKSDTQRFSIYFGKMLDSGINLAPSQFESGFMSLAHTDDDIERTIEASREAFRALK